VPTSRGYGASFGGLAALLTMLNSCAAGVGVMNIDNGFGAGCLAHRINVLGEQTPVSLQQSVKPNNKKNVN
jgi:NCAIR mutase (PurE)-related protein